MNLLLILILLVFTVSILYFITLNNVENFNDSNPNLMGYEEGLPPEYRNIDYKMIRRPSWNKKEFDANNWHLRFPDLVSQRYSYNDKPCKKCMDRTTYNYAKLKELPLDLTHWYYATMPFELAATSLEYYPDVSNRQYEKTPGPLNKCCHQYMDKGPTYTACSTCRNVGTPTIVDNSLKCRSQCQKDRPIFGFDYFNENNIATNAGST